MGPVLILTIVVLGFLIMFRVIPTRKTGKFLFWIIAIAVCGPILLGILKTEALNFNPKNHPWWVYIVAFFVVLILLRALLNFIFPKRRR